MQFQEQAVTPCQLAFHSDGKVIFAASSYVPESNPRPCVKASENLPLGKAFGGISSHLSPPKAQSLPGRAKAEAQPGLCLLTRNARAERPRGGEAIPQREKEIPGGLA